MIFPSASCLIKSAEFPKKKLATPMTKIYFSINARNTNKNVKINGDYIFLFIRDPE